MANTNPTTDPEQAPSLELEGGLTIALEGDMVTLRRHGELMVQDSTDAWLVALACTTHETWGDLARAIDAGAA